MFKKTISMLLMAAFLLNVAFVLPALAGHRLQDQGGGTVTLDARNNNDFDDDDDDDDHVPENATGTAKFDLNKSGEGVNGMEMTVDVENLPEQAQRVYEVWLINDSGSDINLTSFNTDNDGNATVSTTRDVINLAPYDRVVVSTKRIESFQTSRGSTVLSGVLHRSSGFGDFDDEDFDDNGDDFDDEGGFDDEDFDDEDFDDNGDDFDDEDFDDNGDDFDNFDDDFNDDDFNGDGQNDDPNGSNPHDNNQNQRQNQGVE